jgi:hypothetical protein
LSIYCRRCIDDLGKDHGCILGEKNKCAQFSSKAAFDRFRMHRELLSPEDLNRLGELMQDFNKNLFEDTTQEAAQ